MGAQGLFTHFADSWGDRDYTARQLEAFLESAAAAQAGADTRLLLHAANSGGILRGFGHDLDFVRPGAAAAGRLVGRRLSGVWGGSFN
jgi:alanine racemase